MSPPSLANTAVTSSSKRLAILLMSINLCCGRSWFIYLSAEHKRRSSICCMIFQGPGATHTMNRINENGNVVGTIIVNCEGNYFISDITNSVPLFHQCKSRSRGNTRIRSSLCYPQGLNVWSYQVSFHYISHRMSTAEQLP